MDPQLGLLQFLKKNNGGNGVKENEYKKTYKPFIAWLIGFPVILMVITKILGEFSIKVSVLTTLILTVVSLYLLMLIIYKGEYVYWINGGPTYEEAKEAGSEVRKKYAKEHLDIFFKIMKVTLVYGVISFLLKLSIWVDIPFITLNVMVAAFATLSINFEK